MAIRYNSAELVYYNHPTPNEITQGPSGEHTIRTDLYKEIDLITNF